MQLTDLGSNIMAATTTLAATGRAKRPKKSEPAPSVPTDQVSLKSLPRQTTGNTVVPFLGGGKATEEVLSQLGSAKSSIQVEMYRLGYDKIVDVLARQAKAGVKVQVLLDPTPGYDKADAANQTKMKDFLKSAGVEILTYPIDRSGKIDHVKLLIVDRQSAMIGGLNWDQHSHENLDMDVHVQGAAVGDLAGVFDNDWKISGGKLSTEKVDTSSAPAGGDASVRVATTEVDSEAIRSLVLHNINGAKKSIRLVSFALADKDVINALVVARKERNVDVKVLLDPNKPVSYVNQKSKKILEEAGIEVRYLKVNLDTEEKLHAKGMFFDDDTVVLGSANFTNKGLSVNHEANVEIVSKSVGHAMTGFFDDLWNNRSVDKLPNLPDLEERAPEESYGESVAHRLFGWYNDSYHPNEKRNFVGHRKQAILDAMAQYGKSGGRPADDAPEEEQIGALSAFLEKRQVWDVNPVPGSGAKVYQARMDIAKQAEQTVPQHVNEYKQKMLDMVHTPELKSVLKDILEHAPDGFYKSPSSSTGKYHPADETRFADVRPSLDPPSQEELDKYPGGGLVLHSLRNMVLAASLCDYYGIEGRDRDEIVMGESLHDVCKFVSVKDLENWQPGQPVPWGHYTTNDHAHAGAEFVRKLDPTGGKATEKVRHYIDMHMGAWNFPEPTVPKTNAEKIISLADYLASTSDYYVKV
jgi:cardiolipin synthase